MDRSTVRIPNLSSSAHNSFLFSVNSYHITCPILIPSIISYVLVQPTACGHTCSIVHSHLGRIHFRDIILQSSLCFSSRSASPRQFCGARQRVLHSRISKKWMRKKTIQKARLRLSYWCNGCTTFLMRSPQAFSRIKSTFDKHWKMEGKLTYSHHHSV